MSSIDDELAALLDDSPPPPPEPWQPRPWWAWSLGAAAAGVAACVGAGALLSGADLGTGLRPRACTASPLGGLTLLLAGGMLVTLAPRLAQLRSAGVQACWTIAPALQRLALPLLLLMVTLPGVLGCPASADIAAAGSIGQGLVGRSGLMLAAAGVALCGSALAAVLQLSPAHSGHQD